MVAGQTYRLCVPTTGIQIVAGKHATLTVPAGESVSITRTPNGALVECLWKTSRVLFFIVDIEERGKLIRIVSD